MMTAMTAVEPPPSSSATAVVEAAEQRAALLGRWASGADGEDEFGLADELLLAAAEASGDAGSTTQQRAQIALLGGRPADCLGLLSEMGCTDVAASGPGSWADLLLLGARAALGDSSSFGVLLQASGKIGGPDRVLYAYVVATVAELRGEHTMTDEAWRAIVLDHGVRTTWSVTRAAVALVSGRDRAVPAEAIGPVLDAARLIRDQSAPPWLDPTAASDAADMLVVRDDRAGAAALVDAVVRFSRRSDELDDLRKTHVPARRPLRGWAMVGAAAAAVLSGILLSVLDGPVGLGALAVLVIGFRLALRIDLTPELGSSGSALLETIGRLTYDAPTRELRRRGRGRERATMWLMGIAGVVFGLIAAAIVYATLQGSDPDAPQTVSVPVSSVVWVGIPLGCGVGWLFLARSGRRRRARRALSKHDEQLAADHARFASTCRCWELNNVRGQWARDYAAHHLVADPTPPPSLARDVAVRVCPVSALRFLRTVSDSGVTPLLLRGTAVTAMTPPDESAGAGYL